LEAARGVSEAGSSSAARHKPTGFTRVFRAFGNSLKGFAGAFREEAAFRQELAVALVIVPLGAYLGRNGIERALLIAPMLLVLIVELINSAIEATVDRVGLERHRLSGLAKDIGSAAVLLSFVLLVTVWVLVLFDR
jgi:diacylglycerol kinase (ATP)